LASFLKKIYIYKLIINHSKPFNTNFVSSGYVEAVFCIPWRKGRNCFDFLTRAISKQNNMAIESVK
jgi:hypothetical protein